MPTNTSKPPSFSAGRRWAIGANLLTRTLLVLAVAAMVNYLGAQFFHRFYLSSQTRGQLSPQLSSRSLSVVRELTNAVAVTLYYDRHDDFYPDVAALLGAYAKANPKISVRTVDYLRDAGEAEKVKAKYKLGATADKNLIIFDSGNGRIKIGRGDELIQYGPSGKLTADRRLEFAPVAFRGEMLCTATLIALENSRPYKAYFLQGDGEPSPDNTGNFEYLKFAITLAQNFVAVTNLQLSGIGEVPADCDLLIYVAPGLPTAPLREPVVQQIDQYLKQGGRLLALFNYASVNHPTGLEPILQNWGVNVAADVVRDPNNSTPGDVLVVDKFNRHPAVDALAGGNLSLQMVLPRRVSAIALKNPPPDAPQVTELAKSSDTSTLDGNSAAPPQSYPLIVAVEEKNAAGVATPRGATRILVLGDSLLWANVPIDYGGNRDFAASAVNWLLDRGSLLTGIGPRPVTEFRLLTTAKQARQIRWVLLTALPGAVLLFGGLVWLVRRK